MRPVHVLVEGQTEEVFVRDLLAPLRQPNGIHPTAIILTTKRLASGPNHRGGVRSWDQVERQVRRLLGDTLAVAVTTMIDLYALPERWPGLPSTEPAPDRSP